MYNLVKNVLAFLIFNITVFCNFQCCFEVLSFTKFLVCFMCFLVNFVDHIEIKKKNSKCKRERGRLHCKIYLSDVQLFRILSSCSYNSINTKLLQIVEKMGFVLFCFHRLQLDSTFEGCRTLT